MIMTSYDEDERDRLAELAAIWPYDGPHSAATVTDAARAISELVRYINNATSTAVNYPYMSKIAIVANRMAEAIYGLNQLLDQMSRAIDDHIDAGDLYDDHCPNDPFAGAARARLARQQTHQARIAALTVAGHLSQLGSIANSIGHR